MALVGWDFAKHSVNIRDIDQQHQKLFDCLNELYDAMVQGQGRDVIGKVLNDLVDYTVYHFNHEENLFRQHGYPNTASHCAEHAKLANQARALKEKYDAGQVLVTAETLSFLLDWLNTHILGSDKMYVEFLTSKGVR
jgi:hemerythrin